MNNGLAWSGALLLVLTAGCVSEYDIISQVELGICDRACAPEVESDWLNDSGEAEWAGFAVELAAWGYNLNAEATGDEDLVNPSLADYSVNKNRRTSVMGAPYAEVDGSPRGRVHMLRAGFHDGELANVAPRVVEAPYARTAEFGFALLAADVRNGRISQFSIGDPFSTGVIPPTGFGEEVIVGAPGTNDETGEIYWYENQGSFPLPWAYGNDFVPPSAGGGFRFGAAIAAPHDHDADYPDEVTTAVPDWIAVGAPGGDRVYILSVDPASGQPFAVLQELYGPTNSNFGAALSIADFNNDGDYDLAVGAPTSGSGGVVFVYPGDASTSPIRSAQGLIISSSLGAGEFGAALDAGYVNRSDLGRPLLVVGAPGSLHGSQVDAGAICQFQFDGPGPFAVRFDRCDHARSPQNGARFGESVAVGNFIATDGSGETWSSCAESEEVAVGSPGANKWQNGGALIMAGSAQILAQGLAGAEPGQPPTATFWGTEPVQSAGFSMVAEYVQRSVHQDLFFGAPLHGGGQGGAFLSRAELPGEADDNISGLWRGPDSDGEDLDLNLVWTGSQIEITMLEAARLRATRPNGNCSILFTDVDFEGRVPIDPIPWTSSGVDDQAEVVMDISDLAGVPATIYADLFYDAGNHVFTLDIDEQAGILAPMHNDCVVDNLVFSQVQPLLCE